MLCKQYKPRYCITHLLKLILSIRHNLIHAKVDFAMSWYLLLDLWRASLIMSDVFDK